MPPDLTPHTRSDLRKRSLSVVSCDLENKTAPGARSANCKPDSQGLADDWSID